MKKWDNKRKVEEGNEREEKKEEEKEEEKEKAMN